MVCNISPLQDEGFTIFSTYLGGGMQMGRKMFPGIFFCSTKKSILSSPKLFEAANDENTSSLPTVILSPIIGGSPLDRANLIVSTVVIVSRSFMSVTTVSSAMTTPATKI